MSRRALRTLSIFVSIGVAGCASGASELTSLRTPPSLLVLAEASGDADGSGARGLDGSGSGASHAELAAEAPLRPAPPPRVDVEPAQAGFTIGTDGGAIVAGALALTFPAQAVSAPELVEIALVSDATELGRALPGGLAIGAFRTSPWNATIDRAAELRVPLHYRVPAGTPVDLLAWHPHIRGFLVVAQSVVGDDGETAVFRVRQLGDMIVRATPTPGPERYLGCALDAPAVGASIPPQGEEAVVGLVNEGERIPRDQAFSLLSDFRESPAFGLVEFKNEEVDDAGATRRNEREHQDEDFLMDANASAALALLGPLVRREWIDPLSGDPAFTVRVTEAYDSLIEHQVRSTHYQGRALDLTLSPVPAASETERARYYGRLTALASCAGFDLSWFENIFHVHASVVPTRWTALSRAEDGSLLATTWPLAGAGGDRRPLPESRAELLVDQFFWLSGDQLGEIAGTSGLLADAVGTGVPAPSRDDGVLVSAPRFVAPGATSVDGLRALAIDGGSVQLVSTRDEVPRGSVDADGAPEPLTYPLPLVGPDPPVLGAVFEPHRATEEARRLIDASP